MLKTKKTQTKPIKLHYRKLMLERVSESESGHKETLKISTVILLILFHLDLLAYVRVLQHIWAENGNALK